MTFKEGYSIINIESKGDVCERISQTPKSDFVEMRNTSWHLRICMSTQSTLC